MSTLLYQAVTLRREQSPTPEQERAAARAAGEPDAEKKKPGEFLDVVAALVPAEIIAVHALILGAMSTKTEDADGAITTKLDPGQAALQRWSWIGLVIAAAVLYVVPHAVSSARAGRRPLVDRLDLVRMLIPAAAFWIWTMIQKGTLFDAVFSDLSTPARAVVGGFAGLLLVAIAKLLSYAADEAEPGQAPSSAADTVPAAQLAGAEAALSR
jgi:hypothetical protein